MRQQKQLLFDKTLIFNGHGFSLMLQEPINDCDYLFLMGTHPLKESSIVTLEDRLLSQV